MKYTAAKALGTWQAAQATSKKHPYLLLKGITPVGIRQIREGRGFDKRWDLVIPMYDELERIWNIQLITQRGFKRFLTGGRVKGLYHQLGEPPKQKPVLIAEGYATAATLYHATSWPVACAFSAWNVPIIAERLRTLYPHAELYAATDNDEAGWKAARDALSSTMTEPLIPALSGDAGNDWNDYLRRHGLEAVKQDVRGARERQRQRRSRR
ncbi:MAG: toprim domain-containing protein [Chloroflexota bacterium]